MPKLKTISLKTLLLAKEKLPLRPDDHFEHLLERFRVPFDAYRTGKGMYILQRENVVLWLIEGVLHSVELTANSSFKPSDLVNWCGFDFRKDDLLAWCAEQDIQLEMVADDWGVQLYKVPSGAFLKAADGKMWNITLTL